MLIWKIFKYGVVCTINCYCYENIKFFVVHIPETVKKNTDEEEDDVPEQVEDDETPAENEEPKVKEEEEKEDEKETEETKRLFYKRLGRHFLVDTFKGEKGVSMFNITLTSAAYMPSTKLLVTGYSHGAFLLHEMPEVNLIHSLKISNQHISSIAINPTGDWIALGCADMGQLLVWEWQSETYVMKQQGHFDTMSAVAYSPDGSYLATGGRDSKVKGDLHHSNNSNSVFKQNFSV